MRQVELAKKFGGDDSSSFVNGILGKILESCHEQCLLCRDR